MEREYRISQEVKGLGMSGLTQIDTLDVYKGDKLVASIDNYWLMHGLGSQLDEKYICWNSDGTKVGFVAFKYPKGTFPDTEDYLDEIDSQMMMCILDIPKFEILEECVNELPVALKWDDEESVLIYMLNATKKEMPYSTPMEISGDESPYELSKKLKESIQEEFAIAKRNINTATDADKELINNPQCLEYYLFEYDPRYVRESAIHYCVRRRNEYLRSQGLPVPYSEDILNEERR